MSNAVTKSVDGCNQERESRRRLHEQHGAESGLLCTADVFAFEHDG